MFRKLKIVRNFTDNNIGQIIVIKKSCKVLRKGILRYLFPKLFKYKSKGFKELELIKPKKKWFNDMNKKILNSQKKYSDFSTKVTFDENGISHTWLLVRGGSLRNKTKGFVLRPILDEKLLKKVS